MVWTGLNEKKGLNWLRKGDDIVILHTDRGNAVIVMGKNIYDEKMRGIVNDEATYGGLRRIQQPELREKVAEHIRRYTLLRLHL